ncbi:MAG: tRNA pseudouridine(38-40) synthase TruA [Clostridia bacterium]|nr:tRNA pseudouridine(38-40) synthase TruA [Clostridia bacterium]
MQRIQLIVEYDGTGYAGWQRQQNAVSVQQRVEEALSRLTKAPVSVTGASRTDAGVHALGQSAHFDTDSRIPPDKYAYALNTLLPDDIRVRCSRAVPEDFHARFSAKGKEYLYQMHVSPHAPAICRNQRAHVIYPLDEALMCREAESLLGTHDFAAFAAAGSEAKTTVRSIWLAQVERRGEWIGLRVLGNGFLYNMVRIIAGTLIGVGAKKIAPGVFARAFETGSRLDLGVTAPARGLTLMRVFYRDEAQAGADGSFISACGEYR